jgi:hypothetical protein
VDKIQFQNPFYPKCLESTCYGFLNQVFLEELGRSLKIVQAKQIAAFITQQRQDVQIAQLHFVYQT